MFCLKLRVELTMGKVIGRIYKYDKPNCPYPYPKTTFVIPPRFYASTQIQCNSASGASVGANDVASSVLYQINNHHGNMDGKDNYDSQSYKAPR